MDEKKIYADGVHDILSDEYHASAGISRSALMSFKQSPYHYQQKYLIDSDAAEPTESMVLGGLIHTLTLEPNKFDDEFVVMPKFDRRTNIGKAGYHAFQANIFGRSCISEDDYQKAQNIAQAVRQHELGASLLDCVDVERSIYFTHKGTGIQCKSRPDAWARTIIIDLKTTADASYRAFQSSAFKYGYFLQAAMAHEALASINIKMEKFVFIAVEKTFPFAVGIYILDDEALDWGINQFNELMTNYAICVENNKWPSYPVKTLTLPGYAKYELNEMEKEQ